MKMVSFLGTGMKTNKILGTKMKMFYFTGTSRLKKINLR